ncbi:hypothetical protein Csa_012509 [Cucumis sativus]|uniref:Uncharacterized protein n=1 Tax=Cucumis sativus TaxID=3659 RepID=A0A0A0L3V4_CUCSA|nr:hypothetical protein Csa_012509 [Cucumis sativus]
MINVVKRASGGDGKLLEKDSFEEEMKGDPVIILPLSVSGYILLLVFLRGVIGVYDEPAIWLDGSLIYFSSWFCKLRLPFNIFCTSVRE